MNRRRSQSRSCRTDSFYFLTLMKPSGFGGTSTKRRAPPCHASRCRSSANATGTRVHCFLCFLLVLTLISPFVFILLSALFSCIFSMRLVSLDALLAGKRDSMYHHVLETISALRASIPEPCRSPTNHSLQRCAILSFVGVLCFIGRNRVMMCYHEI